MQWSHIVDQYQQVPATTCTRNDGAHNISNCELQNSQRLGPVPQVPRGHAIVMDLQMLDADVYDPIINKVNGCYSNPIPLGLDGSGSSQRSQCATQPRADDAQVPELSGGQWGCARGNLWSICSTKLSHSPGGYDKKQLSTRDALVSKQRKVGNVEDDERWMEEGGIES
ncbi:unnamed protein product [Penicillium egyptiacum]|uniref:Uncharacterized protein n=1 Tax=Penicillium egyptiacum TaxID=1303716 RepID=A0A9W4P144_9EURO|nr:unnamed protein product [Penicillium egyptiacum]